MSEEFTEPLNLILEKLDKILNSNNSNYESSNTQELNEAFAKAQLEFPTIAINRENPYFKSPYADLNAIMKVIRPIIAKNGLSITQRTLLEDGATILQTRLWHSSGQWIESRARIIPSKNDPHTYGSNLTYMKRYQVIALLSITIEDDPDDDDAERDMNEYRNIKSKGTSISNKYNPKEQTTETITKEQLEELEYELSEYTDIGEEILDRLRLTSLADLPKSKYKNTITRVREIKNLRNGINS